MNLDLNGKTALVTASSGGIGLEIARALAAEGATVVINGRTQAGVEQAMAEIRADLPHAAMIPLVADNGTAAGCNLHHLTSARGRYSGQQSRHLRGCRIFRGNG